MIKQNSFLLSSSRSWALTSALKTKDLPRTNQSTSIPKQPKTKQSQTKLCNPNPSQSLICHHEAGQHTRRHERLEGDRLRPQLHLHSAGPGVGPQFQPTQSHDFYPAQPHLWIRRRQRGENRWAPSHGLPILMEDSNTNWLQFNFRPSTWRCIQLQFVMCQFCQIKAVVFTPK